MTPQLLQINYKSTTSRSEFERGFEAVAAEIAKLPGLRWKLWLVSEAESRGGGIYLSRTSDLSVLISKVPS